MEKHHSAPETPVVRYDRPRLKAELHATAARSRELKAIVRQPHISPAAAEAQSALAAERRHATALCSIAAHLRGHVHLAGDSLEEQGKRIAPLLGRYMI